MYEIKYRSPEEMKDSGVKWLGEIPNEWQVKRLKYLTKINPNKRLFRNKTQYCSFVPMNKLHNGSIELNEIKTIQDVYNGYTFFENGDIVMAKVTPCFENGDIAIASNLVNGIGFGTTEINVFRLLCNNDTRFIYYRMQESHFMRYGTSNMTGVAGLKRIPTSYIYNFKIAISNKKHQHKISNFLDVKTAQFDSIISKKELLIKKLEEAKKSLISEVVTGKVKIADGQIVQRQPEEMKDSGVEWLGIIPKDWEVKKLNDISQKIGDGIHGTPIYADNSDYFFINGNNLKNGKIILTETTKSVPLTEYKKYYQKFNNKTIFMSINGTIGNLALYDGKQIILGKSAAFINLLQNIYERFIYYYLQSYEVKMYFILDLTGSTIKNLSLATIRSTKILIPSLEYQTIIIEFLDNKIQILDNIIERIHKQIQKLKQAKQSLISEAVTGKIDLRDWEIIEEGGVQ